MERTLLSCHGAQDLVFKIRYNSLLLNKDYLGNGWSHDYEAYLSILSSNSIKIHWNANYSNLFNGTGNGQFTSSDLPTKHDKLIKNTDGTYTLTRKDHSVYQFNTSGKLTQLQNGYGQVLNMIYDTSGHLIRIFEPVSNQALTLHYNGAGLIDTVTDNLGRQVSFTYDASNNLTVITDANGNKTTYAYQYDDAGRLASFTDPAGTVSYTYDPNGNVLTVNDAVYGVITRTYDALNRVTSYTDTQGNTIQYTYDPVGNLTTLTYPGGRQVHYTYDPANRLTSVTDWANRTTTYQYDQNNRLVKTTRPDGSVLTMSYDAAGQLLQQKDVDANGKVVAQYDYTYDNVGNPLTEQTVPHPQPFYLPNTVCTYTYDNRIATYNSQPVTYDNDGNMTYGPLTGVMSTYTYDARNRLTTAGTTTYLYDAENNRIGVADSVYQINDRYVINPQATFSQVLIKIDAQGNKTYYVYGLGLIGQEDSAGNYLTYHFDRRGSTVALTDITGNVTDTFQYGPYGELVNRTGTTTIPFLYCGQYGVMTDHNGLYYMRARYYNPDIKRFINQDVLLGDINNGQSLNRFAYVNGQPVLYVDQDGHFWMLIGAGVGALVGGGADLVVQGLTKGWHNINYKEVLVNTAAGAATGLVATSTFVIGAVMAVNAGVGAGSYIATQSWNHKPITAGGLAVSTLAGVIGGAIGGPGMLSGATGKALAKITAAGNLAKCLGLKSGQEIARIKATDLLIKAGRSSLARTVAGYFAAAFVSSGVAEASSNK